MITNVFAKNFKGLEFSQDLTEKNLFIGPNGIGKSGRSQALILAILGYIPGSNKKPGGIMDNFATDDTMIVGFVKDNIPFERSFIRSSRSTVSQKYRVNKRKVDKNEFAKELALAGDPKIIDLGEFIDLSDQGKIDMIFDLFPPGEDVNLLEDDIDKVKTAKNKLHEDIRVNEKTIKKLMESRAELKMPPGTLSETQNDIKETEDSYRDVQAEITSYNAKIKAEKAAEKKLEKEKEKINAEADKKIENQKRKSEKKAEETIQENTERVRKQAESDLKASNERRGIGNKPDGMTMLISEYVSKQAEYTESFDKILTALEKSGCNVCAAKLVCLSEKMKYAV